MVLTAVRAIFSGLPHMRIKAVTDTGNKDGCFHCYLASAAIVLLRLGLIGTVLLYAEILLTAVKECNFL